MQRNERIRLFVREIWAWYARHKRTLPWRDLPDRDFVTRAYKILVSEIMLQQTQVPRVIIKYKEFLERFPTVRHLADASNKEILLIWRGMGYNSRALRLRDAAKQIMENGKWKIENDEVFPSSMEALMTIPGIGHYTAAAVRNFAFNIPTPCIDTNIRRILHRTFVGPENSDGTWEKDDEYLLGIAADVLKEATQGTKETKGISPIASIPFVPFVAADWHAALMDFGSLVQAKRNPKWDVCPLTEKGIMKTTKRNFELRISDFGKKGIRNPQFAIRNQRREPGRIVGSTFIPNRIFRGRVIEALRDAPKGLTLHDIGQQIALDWNPSEHREWLSTILKKLQGEKFLELRRMRYSLAD